MKKRSYLQESLTKEQLKRIEATEKMLMSVIDTDNDIEIEKVERYSNLLRLFYALDTAIDEMGPMSHIKNGSQEYIKQNPAIAEKNRVNSALLSLEKSFQLDKRAEEKRKLEAQKGPELT